MSDLYRDDKGRWRNKAKGNRYASKAELLAAGINIDGGSGDDKITVTVNSAPSRKGRGGGGGGGCMLRTETVTRVRYEDGVDLVAGLLGGLLARARRQSVSTVHAEAARLWDAAHPDGGAEAKRDATQQDYGRQLAEVFGLVAVHLGWTAADWVAAMPPELAVIAHQRQIAGTGSPFVSDDMADEVAGSVASMVVGDVAEVVGAGIGSVFGPTGTLIGKQVGSVLGIHAGRQMGVAAANKIQGESPVVQEDGVLDLFSAAQAAAAH